VNSAAHQPGSDAPDGDDDAAPLGEAMFRVESPAPGRLEVHGEVDAATAAFLDDALLEAAATSRGDGGEVVLDCSGLTFIDSSGLSVLVTTHQRLSSESRRFVVHQPPPAARRLFEIAGLDQVLTIT
jgi:anti-sigma B factor antagonist